MEAAEYLKWSYDWERSYTSLPENDFIEWWNDQMLFRYNKIQTEKKRNRENMVKRIMLVYKMKQLPLVACFQICNFLKPGPPDPLPLRRYTNCKCTLCGDYLEYMKRPCFTCGTVRVQIFEQRE